MPIVRLSQSDIQAITHRWETDQVAYTNLPRAAGDIRNLLRELRATVAERDTARIDAGEWQAKWRGMVAELNANYEARGLLAED